MIMAKKKENLMEVVSFNSYEEAKDIACTAKRRKIRHLIALAISALATGFTAYGLFGASGTEMIEYFVYAFMLAIPAYLIGGGFGKVLKTAGKLAKFGWLILPFPLDIFTGLLTFVAAAFALFCVPLFFTFTGFVQCSRDYKSAQKHLSHYQVETVEVCA